MTQPAADTLEREREKLAVYSVHDVRQAFTAWQRTTSLSREAHHAATRVCNSLRMCAEYPDRELFVRMLEQDVAQLNAALGAGR